MFKCQEGYTLRKIKGVSYILPFGQQIADQHKGTILNETSAFLWNVIQHNEGADLEMLTEMLARRYGLEEKDFPMLREDILVQRRISPEITTSTVIAWRRNIPYSLAVSKMIEEINAFVTCL